MNNTHPTPWKKIYCIFCNRMVNKTGMSGHWTPKTVFKCARCCRLEREARGVE